MSKVSNCVTTNSYRYFFSMFSTCFIFCEGRFAELLWRSLVFKFRLLSFNFVFSRRWKSSFTCGSEIRPFTRPTSERLHRRNRLVQMLQLFLSLWLVCNKIKIFAAHAKTHLWDTFIIFNLVAKALQIYSCVLVMGFCHLQKFWYVELWQVQICRKWDRLLVFVVSTQLASFVQAYLLCFILPRTSL